ncbi:Sigma-54-dependent Fis family transcriptional regulator [Sulfidibacter corallicola]|uniref:Sigma-54-dependent Fis family transcriptional regulator n=1 Tax=Sulfidibacter corallicola TaxID=2818388 RepID=A0A8A4TGH3_SULCO|nr:sigma-54 dependent transcriptional regulator [Sulfidibacter corallicola]QTD49169.1 sigma-54-dependent Fis family transcriptional regulator [Sulfidibacter corallicola]
MPQILVVEDHDKIRANLLFHLQKSGRYEATGVASAEEAESRLAQGRVPDLMLLDIRLGGKSGVDFIRELDAKQRLPPTIVVSGEASISETVEALRLGVYDFIEKPVSRERLLRSVRNCLDHHALKSKLVELEARLSEGSLLLGDSLPMKRLKDQCAKVGPTEGRVLIRGESGTGKELVANWVHRASKRADGPFVKINCAAIPMNLIEDELFGHVRGAFTDARTDKAGLFELAHGGTLFLDEIGDMELGLQARLLRVLEDGQVRRLGDTRDRRVDVRIVAATHRSLEELIGEGTFREDLYFRLNTLPLEIPPLRQRGDDIAMLFTWFTAHYCRRNGIRQKGVAPAVTDILKRYHWPGNVRELKNLAERLVILGGDPIDTDDLPSDIIRGESNLETGFLALNINNRIMPLRQFRAQCEKEYIERILRRTDYNYTEAAKLLEIQRTYLYQKAQTLGVRKG